MKAKLSDEFYSSAVAVVLVVAIITGVIYGSLFVVAGLHSLARWIGS